MRNGRRPPAISQSFLKSLIIGSYERFGLGPILAHGVVKSASLRSRGQPPHPKLFPAENPPGSTILRYSLSRDPALYSKSAGSFNYPAVYGLACASVLRHNYANFTWLVFPTSDVQ